MEASTACGVKRALSRQGRPDVRNDFFQLTSPFFAVFDSCRFGIHHLLPWFCITDFNFSKTACIPRPCFQIRSHFSILSAHSYAGIHLNAGTDVLFDQARTRAATADDAGSGLFDDKAWHCFICQMIFTRLHISKDSLVLFR